MPDDSGRMHRVVVRFAAGAFVIELLLAEGALRGFSGRGVTDLLHFSQGLPLSLIAGLIVAAVVAAVSRSFFATFARDLTVELLVPIFRGLPGRDIAALSMLPGLGEEVFFRGALQPIIGIAPTAIVFGLLHSGFSRRLLPYGIWATIVGGLLGALYLWTGNLWGSIVAHAVINASGAIWLRRLEASRNDAGTRGG